MSELTGNILEEVITLLIEGDFELRRYTQTDFEEQNLYIYSIHVNRSEYGKVCGAKGKMIRSIKYIWEVCMCRHLKKQVRVSLKEPSSGYSKGRQPDVPEENFDADLFLEVVSDIVEASSGGIVSYERFKDTTPPIFTYTVKYKRSNPCLGEEYKLALESVFNAIAKANGGNIVVNING